MISDTKSQRNTFHLTNTKLVLFLIVITHLIFVIFLQLHTTIGGDGIFTYTLANNPYSFEYIDSTLSKLPQSNGWIDASVFRESYIVQPYSRFNYSSVYFHQRIDNHPLLYYSLVHTVSSLFPGSYSPAYTMIINFIFIALSDIVIISLFYKMYKKLSVSTVPFCFLFLTVVLQKLYILPRMYMMLAFFCLWYLYIHWHLLQNEYWCKKDLLQMIFCIFLGSQTHYYFYVFAGLMSLFTFFHLLKTKKLYYVCNYVCIGILGIILSWIIFPWIIWHIFFNQMQKHTSINPWTLNKLSQYIHFLNVQLFNSRGYIASAIFILILILFLKSKLHPEKELPLHSVFFRIAFITTLLFSLIIYTLDENIWYYSTPLYLSYVVLISIVILDCVKTITRSKPCIWLPLSLFLALVISGITPTISFINEQFGDAAAQKKFHQIACQYTGADCVFVEQRQDNLLQGNYFEFGNYNRWKKISYDDFQQYGLSKEFLTGHKCDRNLLIYIPSDWITLSPNYQLLISNGQYSIYLYQNKE